MIFYSLFKIGLTAMAVIFMLGCEESTTVFTSGGTNKTVCSQNISVDLRFILDTTTSMEAIFPVIKSNAETFSAQIASSIEGESSQSEFRFGLSTFFESGSPRHLSYKNLDGFLSDVNQLKVTNILTNQDYPENGIQALETLLDTGLTANRLQIIFFVSDNLAHRGGLSFNRDFSMDTLLNKIGEQALNDSLLFFDATPYNNENDPYFGIPNPITNTIQTLPTYANSPAAQWEYLRQTSNGKIIGQSFGFPLESSILNEKVPVYLAEYKRENCS